MQQHLFKNVFLSKFPEQNSRESQHVNMIMNSEYNCAIVPNTWTQLTVKWN